MQRFIKELAQVYKMNNKYMRKFFFYSFIGCFVLVFAACLKKDQGCPYKELTVKSDTANVAKVVHYLDSLNLLDSAHKDSSGVYYIVQKQGTGLKPEVCSMITVNYTGKLVNGNVFDKTNGTSVSFRLGDLISGWQKGVQHINGGGTIRLFIPSDLGYGNKDAKDNNGNIVIPANSILIFTIDLVDVR